GIRVIQAAAQNPTLAHLKWFGTDGSSGSSKMAQQIGDIIVSLGGLPSTNWEPASNPLQTAFKARFKSIYGEDPDAYSMNAYDAAWLIALAVMTTGQYNGETIAKALPTIAQHYYGVTGNTALDQNGDRSAGDYAIWTVVQTPNGYNWTQIAVYNSITDQVTRV
ncbi:MAG: ABC transporter substrate-binding protein, partial [Infirmifilum sp.]